MPRSAVTVVASFRWAFPVTWASTVTEDPDGTVEVEITSSSVPHCSSVVPPVVLFVRV